MPITYGDSGTSRTPYAITYRDGGTSRTILEIWYGDGGVNRRVFTYLSASAPNISAQGPAGSPVIGNSTVSVTGGVGPFTYLWSITSGSNFSLSNTTSATVTATLPAGPVFATGTIQCIVTDTATGASVTVSGVTVQLDHI